MTSSKFTSDPLSDPFSDPSLQAFFAPSFDPVNYVNGILPVVSAPSQSPIVNLPADQNSSTLSDVSARAHSLLSQLSAQSAKLSTLLTSETDQLLRHGPRLAFEVDTFADEVSKLRAIFAPHRTGLLNRGGDFGGMDELLPSKIQTSSTKLNEQPLNHPSANDKDKDYLKTLNSLATARARLEGVIKLFGEATKWPTPSLDFTNHPFSADPLSTATTKFGDEVDAAAFDPFVHSLRVEIALSSPEVLSVASQPSPEVIKQQSAAQEQINALRILARLWKGTPEEKARNKVVDELSRLAFDNSRRQEREKLRKAGAQADKAPDFLQNLALIVKAIEEGGVSTA